MELIGYELKDTNTNWFNFFKSICMPNYYFEK